MSQVLTERRDVITLITINRPALRNAVAGPTAAELAEAFRVFDADAEHWVHIMTSNPIESTSAMVRLRTKRTRNCGSRSTTLAMVYRTMLSTQ